MPDADAVAAPSSSAEDHLRRWRRWYGQSRLGLFYHWGWRTGGGDSSSHAWGGKPYKHPTISAFEAAAGEPARVAANLVDMARTVGAGYVIFTALHSCDRFTVTGPTAVAAFRHALRRDYLGALVDACHAAGLGLLLYVPAAAGAHWNTAGGPWLDPRWTSDDAFSDALLALVSELVERHGDRLGGFWLDGYYQPAGAVFAAHVRRLLPDALVVMNNDTRRSRPGCDVSASECTTGPCTPPYNRPSGLVLPHAEWGTAPPQRDFNEDIPVAIDWFHSDRDPASPATSPYVRNRCFWVRQAICSLGQRGRWNHALGIGPREDGTPPPLLAPTLAAMGAFMAWAAPAIRGTRGGEGSAIAPGWWADGAFGSVTVDLDDSRRHWLLVTEAPSGPRLRLPQAVRGVAAVTDLRTGRALPFSDRDGLVIEVGDWEDVARYGAKVVGVEIDAAC